jgi:two-component system LytT family response regulator
MNCLIVDDEKPALELLEDNIRQVSFLTLAATARNATEAMVVLTEHTIDLMFLDIQMPGITGLEFLGQLRHPPLVILVTAFQQHALDGFELDVVDYLVKPVPFPRFLKAVQKAQNLFKLKQQAQLTPSKETEHVFVNANYSLVRVMICEITFIEGLKDYVRINMISGKTVITRLGLKAIEEKLNNGRFMRVHKSFIIALDKIDSIQKTQLVIQGREIPIGEGYRQFLQNYINSKNL